MKMRQVYSIRLFSLISLLSITGPHERFQDMFFYADVVMHYSTCALIQRAVTTDNVTFNQECLESSRAASGSACASQFNI